MQFVVFAALLTCSSFIINVLGAQRMFRITQQGMRVLSSTTLHMNRALQSFSLSKLSSVTQRRFGSAVQCESQLLSEAMNQLNGPKLFRNASLDPTILSAASGPRAVHLADHVPSRRNRSMMDLSAPTALQRDGGDAVVAFNAYVAESRGEVALVDTSSPVGISSRAPVFNALLDTGQVPPRQIGQSLSLDEAGGQSTLDAEHTHSTEIAWATASLHERQHVRDSLGVRSSIEHVQP